MNRNKRLFKKLQTGVIVAILGGVGSVSQADEATPIWSATTMYLDFGGGNIDTTVGALEAFNGFRELNNGPRDIQILGTGPDLSNNLFSGDPGLQPGNTLHFRPLEYDFDGNGAINELDIDALVDAVTPIIERAVEPFNINVEVVQSSSLEAAKLRAIKSNGTPDPSPGSLNSSPDAYNFAVSVITPVEDSNLYRPVGVFNNRNKTFGALAFRDNFGGSHIYDEATLTLVENLLDYLREQQNFPAEGTQEFNDRFAHLVAFVMTQEAFHTFGFGEIDTSKASNGDVVRAFAGDFKIDDITSQFIVTRFDLLENVPSNETNYDRAARVIGLRDDNSNRIPNLAYVTGTGLGDRIRLTWEELPEPNPQKIKHVRVRVESGYEDEDETPRGYDYWINPWTDTESTILIDGSIGDDVIIVDSSIPLNFRVRGGPGNDSLEIRGDHNFTLSEGQISIRNGLRTADFEEIDNITITGGPSDNWFEVAANFTGNATIDGGRMDDVCYDDIDFIVAERDADFILKDSSLTSNGLNVDLVCIEKAALTGGVGHNILDASSFSGSTFLFGLAGNDKLTGGSGEDYLDGGEGNDEIFGGLRDDVLLGGPGADNLSGGFGFDTLDAGGDVGDVEVQ